MHAFSLTKWYLDCVDADGNAAIAYWSSLVWRGIAITWHRLSVHEAGTEPLDRSSARSVPPPVRTNGTLTWEAAPLGCRVTSDSLDEAFSRQLLDDDDGSVDWRCESAHGVVTVECENRRPILGIGYAECLTMTLPPWRLPIETLKWGRWLSDSSRRSVVWIEWQGPKPLTAVFVDGRLQRAARVDDDGISADEIAVSLTDRQTLYSRSLVDTLGVLRPALAPLLPPAWLNVEDCKWRSRGRLRTEGRVDETGWVIHETVRWPS